MGYRIKTISALTGIPKNTLVSWERRYHILDPERRLNRYRIYSDNDLALLKRLKGYLDEGLKISEAVERLQKTPEGVLPPLQVAPPPPPPAERDGVIREQLLQALLRYDRAEAERVMMGLLSAPYLFLIRNIIFPILRAIGAGWAAGELSVAQEHFASAFLRDQMVAMLLRTGCGPAHGKHTVCVTFPQEKHEIALLGLAIHLSLSGYRVTYLGADLPVRELCRFSAQHRPACVYVSAINPVTKAGLLEYARELRAGVPPETRLCIGGSGLPERLPAVLVKGVELWRDWELLELP